MKQYEYNVLTNRYSLIADVLNILGKEGWELVSHTYSDKSSSIEDEHVYTFKREKISLPKGIANTLTAYQGEDPLPLYDGKTGKQVNKKKFKLDDSFKKRMEEAVVENVPASSWMDAYREEYDRLLASGMFFEFHPTWTGVWDRDKYAFCHEFIKKHEKGTFQDPTIDVRKELNETEKRLNKAIKEREEKLATLFK